MGLFGMNLDAAEMVVRWTTPVARTRWAWRDVRGGVSSGAARGAGLPHGGARDPEVPGVGRPLRMRAVAASVVGAAGAAAAGAARGGRPLPAASLLGPGVVLTLVAAVIAGPLLVRPVIRVLGGAFPRVFGPVGG